MSWPVCERWPEGVADEWVALPILLLRHASALDLDDGDVRLLVALEVFRREGDGDDEVYPGQETLAELCGSSIDTVARRAKRLAARGLIEVERRKVPGSRYRVNHYTRNGLDRKLADLVAECDYPAPVQGGEAHYPAPLQGGEAHYPADHPAPLPDEVEGTESSVPTAVRMPSLLQPAPLQGGEIDYPAPVQGGGPFAALQKCVDCDRGSAKLTDGRCAACHQESVWQHEEAS